LRFLDPDYQERCGAVPKPFDATTKHLVEARPAAWLEYAGLPRADVDVIDADLSTVTADADRVLRVNAPAPWLAHLEFQAGYDRDLGERTLQYNVLLHRRHGLPVQSVVLLLRPEADGPEMTGVVQHRLPWGDLYHEFRYQVVRAWQKPVEAVLSGGLGTLPLAPLSDVSRAALPGVIDRMKERIRREAPPDEAGLLWTATYVLMGLRYPENVTEQLLQGVRDMKESVTYQAILAEGRAEGLAQGRAAEARAILLRIGGKRFGPPSAQTRAAIEGVTSVERLELLTERLLDVESWDELLAEP
jgi:predicted transposase YdaD